MPRLNPEKVHLGKEDRVFRRMKKALKAHKKKLPPAARKKIDLKVKRLDRLIKLTAGCSGAGAFSG